MANFTPQKDYSPLKTSVLHAAAKLFLEKGYSNTTTREIASLADVNVTTMNRYFGSKENILAALVEYVLAGQFTAAREMVAGKTEDEILFYAAETTLQLYMSESSEHIRDLYSAAYSLPNTSAIIQQTITGELQKIFSEHLPELDTMDFYMLEIASGGIMRGFMTVPCNMFFTMEMKVESFLRCTFKLYDVPEEKIQEAIEFVGQFDYPTMAKHTIEGMLTRLEKNESVL